MDASGAFSESLVRLNAILSEKARENGVSEEDLWSRIMEGDSAFLLEDEARVCNNHMKLIFVALHDPETGECLGISFDPRVEDPKEFLDSANSLKAQFESLPTCLLRHLERKFGVNALEHYMQQVERLRIEGGRLPIASWFLDMPCFLGLEIPERKRSHSPMSTDELVYLQQ